mgnify:CR=1 FL=1
MKCSMIKKIWLIVLVYSGLFAQSGFFVKFRENVSNVEIDKTNQKIVQKVLKESSNTTNKGISLKLKPLNQYYFEKGIEIGKIFFVDFNDTLLNNKAKENYSDLTEIEYTQNNNIYKLDYVPNDEYVNKQWALNTTKAFEAWDITKGSKNVLIAIIDTGIDYLHPDLNKNLYVNEAEDLNKNGVLDSEDINGIDDDNNGFTDDVIGWDFTDRVGFPFSSTGGDYIDWDNNPMDEYGHGTWVAGVIGAVSNNGEGITGLVPNTSMLNIRAFDPTGNGEEDDAAAGILYAVEMGAKVINMSFGDVNFSLVLRDVIRFAYDNGVVLIASAGNSSSNQPHYPSSYPEVISCGATDNNDYLASFSNTGSTIDLVAPGVNLYTTDRNSGYREFSGTSSSAPVVTSAAALLLSLENFNPEEIKQILKSTAVDLGSSGWDEKFGAGRIDILSAVSIKAPAIIKLNSPKQDFSTNSDTLVINASVLSGYFDRYELQYGYGINPSEWVTLIGNGKNQFVNRDLYKLDLKNLNDSVYCVKLKVYFKNGLTTEERANFYIIRNSAEINLLALAPAFYGDVSTILGSLYTNELCTAFMHYKRVGESEFKVISLDGFSTNNMFYKQLHYGFIPLDITSPNETYEIFFEAKNLAGNSSYLYNDGNYFVVKTDNQIINEPKTVLSYSLPYGRLSDKSYIINGISNKTLFENSYDNSSTLKIYSFDGNKFVKIDSINNRQVPKSVGDFNNNGKTDFLSYFYPKATIDEQKDLNSTKFSLKFVDSTAVFRPIFVEDINNDQNYELLALTNDTTISVFKVTSDFKLELIDKAYNFSPNLYGNYYKNSFGSPSAVISNGASGENAKELWLIDSEGDIVCYYINENGQLQNGISITTGLLGLKNLLTAGDFDGDGQNDIAALLESEDTPFKLLLVFNIKNSKLNVIAERFFIDPSIQFSSLGIKPKANVKFAKLFDSNRKQLFVNTYPYSYIFDYRFNKTEGVLFNKNNDVKANEYYYNTFVDDLNSNGINEFSLPVDNKIVFYEFGSTTKTPSPVVQKGYSMSGSKAFIKWMPTGSKTYIYKGLSEDNISLYDSTYYDFIIDSNLTTNNYYFYKLQSYNANSTIKLSDLTESIGIYIHDKINYSGKKVIKGNSVEIEFNGKINTAVLNLESFKLSNGVRPSSILASSEKSYIINFSPSLQKGNYTLIVNDLIDYYGSPIDNFSFDFNVDEIITTENFYITEYNILEPKVISISMNLDIDKSTFSKAENYLINPYNKVQKVDFIGNNTVVIYLNYPVKSTGVTHTIKLENVKSSIEAGNILISEGAGSFLVLSTNADNLSDMYVYPNPFSLSESDGMVYFANIPIKTDIIIFDINGNRIAEISERDGNGGTTWNLTDLKGDKVGSGVYLYRAAVIDEGNKEIEVKLGKFAITR